MSKNQKLIAISIIILSIGLFSNGGYFKEILKDESARVPYKDMEIDNISLKNDSSVYSMKGGDVYQDGVKISWMGNKAKINRVLRLALFFQWMKEDPLFFSSTLDTGNLKASLQPLKREQSKILDKSGWEHNILATNFIDKFIESSASYKDLQNNVSEENAKKLLEKIKNANKEYYSDADNLENEIQKVLLDDPKMKEDKIVSIYADNYTDSSVVLSDLLKIKENSLNVKKELEERQKCLLESLEFCRRPAENFREPKTPDFLKDKTPNLLSKETLGLDEKDGYFGPYEIESSCWGSGGGQYLYIDKFCPYYKDFCYDRFTLANGAYFKKIPAENIDVFHLYLKDMGAELEYQKGTTAYTCSDIGYKPKIANLSYFYRNFSSRDGFSEGGKDNRLFQRIKNKEDFNSYPEGLKELILKAEVVENSFFDAQYPSEEAFEDLADHYAYAYGYFVAKNIAGGEEKEELLNRYILIKENFSDFNFVINESLNTFSSYVGTTSKAIRITGENKAYAYLSRSEYSLYFLNFDDFNWRSGSEPEYSKEGSFDSIKKGTYLEDFINYETAVSSYGKENVLKWIKLRIDSSAKRHELGREKINN